MEGLHFELNACGVLRLWRDSNQRAVVEQRIEEPKREMHAEGFCMRDFFGTESAFFGVLFAFNLPSFYQKVAQPTASYRQPARLRAAVFLGEPCWGEPRGNRCF